VGKKEEERERKKKLCDKGVQGSAGRKIDESKCEGKGQERQEGIRECIRARRGR
jgi:hypothetical protein